MTTRSKKTDAQIQPESTVEQTNAESEQLVHSVDLESLYAKPAADKRNLKVTLFSSTACSPCKTIKPFLENWMRGIDAEYLVLTIDPNDIDEEVKRNFDDYGVTQVPTIVCEKDGKEISRTTGYSGNKQLEDFLIVSIRK